MGVMSEAENVPPEEPPPAADIETARLYGVRVAQLAKKIHS
jgi:hypothetical protein